MISVIIFSMNYFPKMPLLLCWIRCGSRYEADVELELCMNDATERVQIVGRRKGTHLKVLSRLTRVNLNAIYLFINHLEPKENSRKNFNH